MSSAALRKSYINTLLIHLTKSCKDLRSHLSLIDPLIHLLPRM